ncbi:MAG: esterase-like activity of phytase family protein [Geminicoccaceae bacterium]
MAREVRLAGHLLFWAVLALVQPVHASDDGGQRYRFEGEPVIVNARRSTEVPESVHASLGAGVVVEAVYELRSKHASFGGLSGLWIAPDAERMLVVSDIGKLWQARLVHDAAGGLIGVEDWSVRDLPLLPEEERRSPWRDAEALAELGSGGLVVAYEGEHRLRHWRHGDFSQAPRRLVRLDGIGDPSNSGIEALATLEDGRLLALAERVGAVGGEGLMGWVVDGDVAEDLVYLPKAGFSPTGADRLEKTVFVVERRFSLIGGFQTRIVALSTEAIRPGARVKGTELAAFRYNDIGENFEAIAARRAPDGRILLYLLADDNFSFFQETLLVQLSLSTEGLVD